MSFFLLLVIIANFCLGFWLAMKMDMGPKTIRDAIGALRGAVPRTEEPDSSAESGEPEPTT